MLPTGTYKAVATENPDDGSYVRFGETSKGKTEATVMFEVIEGVHTGQRITWRAYFATEKNAKRTIEGLRQCGFTGDDLAAATSQTLDKPVDIVVAHEEYNGRVSAKVQWVNAPGSGGPTTMEPDKLASFAKSMRAIAKSVPIPETPLPGPSDEDLDV